MTTALSSGEERGRGSGKGSYTTLEGSRNKGRMNSREIFLSPSPPLSAPPLFHLFCFLCAVTCVHAHIHVEAKRQPLVWFFRHYPYFISCFEMGGVSLTHPKLSK